MCQQHTVLTERADLCADLYSMKVDKHMKLCARWVFCLRSSSVSSFLSLNTTLGHIKGNQAQQWRAEDVSRTQPLKLNGASQGVRLKKKNLLGSVNNLNKLICLWEQGVPLQRYLSVDLPVSTEAHSRSTIFLFLEKPFCSTAATKV